jgi:hypothetical protein
MFDLATVQMFEFEFEFLTLPLGQLMFGHVTYKTCMTSEVARYL